MSENSTEQLEIELRKTIRAAIDTELKKSQEDILIVSLKGKQCEACEIVTEFIKAAIEAGKVRVVDALNDEGMDILITLYGKDQEKFMIPLYVKRSGSKYEEGDLRELMVMYG